MMRVLLVLAMISAASTLSLRMLSPKTPKTTSLNENAVSVDTVFVKEPKATTLNDLGLFEVSAKDAIQAPLRDWPVSVMTYPLVNGKGDVISRSLQGKDASWEPAAVTKLCEEFRKYGAKGNLLDVGANIGSFTLPLASCLKQFSADSSILIAVEASPENQKMLKGGIKYNSLSNIHLYEYAVSSPIAPDTLEIAEHQGNHGHSGVDGEVHDQSSDNPSDFHFHATPVTTLDSILKVEGDAMKRVFAMKMDIEGHEPMAIAGAEEFFKSGPCMVFIELAGGIDGALAKLLQKNGYVATLVEKGVSSQWDGWFERADMQKCVANL